LFCRLAASPGKRNSNCQQSQQNGDQYPPPGKPGMRGLTVELNHDFFPLMYGF
jgi:hypothetical protein